MRERKQPLIDNCLGSWKEIASYLAVSVRTAQRWEKLEGLPVQRHHHAKQGSVYAFRAELDAWRAQRSQRPSTSTSAQADKDTSNHQALAVSPSRALRSWHERLAEVAVDLAGSSSSPRADGSRPSRSFSTYRARVRASTDSGDFVGREREWSILQEYTDAAMHGRGSIVCLGGEPGVGKTTLAEALLDDVVASNPTAVVGRGYCSQRLAGTEAYLPLLETLENLLDGPSGSAIGRLMELVAPTWYVRLSPLWAITEPEFAAIAADARAASRERMKRELRRFVAELTQIRPLVILIDDVHWADPSTVEMLAYLSERITGQNVLFVVTYRAAELAMSDHAFGSVKAELQSSGIAHDVTVGLLDYTAVAAYVAQRCPGADRFGEFVYALTEGNALFMVALTADMTTAESKVESMLAWHQPEIVSTDNAARSILSPLVSASNPRSWRAISDDLPASVRSMIQRILDRLAECDRRLLDAASVHSGDFESAVLSDALALEPAEVERRLRNLERSHALVEQREEHTLPGGALSVRYRFVHVLYQDSLYHAMGPTQRASTSYAVAEALTAHYSGATKTIASDLALLWHNAREFARACDNFLASAENALRLYANSEALTLAERAIADAEKLPAPKRQRYVHDAARLMAHVYQTSARFKHAIASYQLAESLSQYSYDPNIGSEHRSTTDTGVEIDAEIDAICGLSTAYFYLKDLDNARVHGLRALDRGTQANSKIGIAKAEAVLGRERLCSGHLDAAREYYNRSIPVLKRHQETSAAMDAMGFRILLHAWQLEHEDCDREWAWWQKQTRINPAHAAPLKFYRAMALGNRGHMGGALTAVDEGMHLSELNDDKYCLCRLPNTLAWLHRELGDIESATRLDRQSIELAVEFGYAEAEANAHVNLARNFTEARALDRTREHLDHALRILANNTWFSWRYRIRLEAELIFYHIAGGDIDRAAHHADNALAQAKQTTARKHIAWVHKLRGDIAVLNDAVERACNEYRRALSTLDGYPCPLIEWRIATAWAGAESLRGRANAADELRRRSKRVTNALAESLTEDALRRQFRNSVRDVEEHPLRRR